MAVCLSSLIRSRSEPSLSKSLACKLYWSIWRLVVERELMADLLRSMVE
jgi:hypothetical protein